MPSGRDIERFIGDSFSTVWDLELLAALLERPDSAISQSELVEHMRASDQVVLQGTRALTAAGLATVDGEGRLRFNPVNDQSAQRAREAIDFYRGFANRVRRLLVARQAPGLNAFADAFRLRKD